MKATGFELVRQQVPVLSVAQYLLKPGRRPYLFYFPGEQEPSIKIYPKSNSFYDFGRAVGGDCIRLWSRIQQIDSWKAAQEIASVWGLDLGADDKITAREIRQRQQAKLEATQARERAWKRWRQEVDLLKMRESFFVELLQSPHIKPFSEPWCWAINDLQKIRYRLDVLCGVER